MSINFTDYRAAIETTYTDRATIYRYKEVEDPNSKTTKLAPVPVYSDQPCRISQKALGRNGQTEAQNDILYETKLFIAPEAEILQGDMLEVTRGRMTAAGWEPIAATRKYTAGEPFIYPTHQEVSLERKEWA